MTDTDAGSETRSKNWKVKQRGFNRLRSKKGATTVSNIPPWFLKYITSQRLISHYISWILNLFSQGALWRRPPTKARAPCVLSRRTWSTLSLVRFSPKTSVMSGCVQGYLDRVRKWIVTLDVKREANSGLLGHSRVRDPQLKSLPPPHLAHFLFSKERYPTPSVQNFKRRFLCV